MKMSKRNIKVRKRRKILSVISVILFLIGFGISIILVGTSDWEAFNIGVTVISSHIRLIMLLLVIITMGISSIGFFILRITE